MNFARYIAISLLACFTGCAGITHPRPYSIVVANRTDATLLDAFVAFGEFRSLGGIYRAGISKHDELVPYPIPHEATVEWKTPDGINHVKNIVVSKMLPKNFSGEITFSILPDETVQLAYSPY